MSDPVRVVAGDCTVRERDGSGSARERRGRVVVVVKPDDTVLVHDTDGYQPVAWLTRADGVAWERSLDASGSDPDGPGADDEVDDAELDPDAGTDGAGADDRDDGSDGGDQVDGAVDEPAPEPASEPRPAFSLTARKDRRVLLVTAHGEVAVLEHDATAAGVPVGDCRCGGPLVRADGRVRCLDCGATHGLPRDAAVLEDACDCGLPRIAAERGERFELCLARDCEHSRSLDEAVREAFDREWPCPDCGADLRVLRRGGLLLGCERYPDCETGLALPTGVVAGDCACGLPAFETDAGRRCLDSTCERPLSSPGESDHATAGEDA